MSSFVILYCYWNALFFFKVTSLHKVLSTETDLAERSDIIDSSLFADFFL
jgi:hypothetical protein